MERVLDARLIDPAQRGQPVALSIDSRVQSILEIRARQRGHLDERRGRHRHRPRRPDRRGRRHGLGADLQSQRRRPRRRQTRCYNRATMGVYELGSTFKPITIAAAMEAGVVTSMHQRWDASAAP